MKFEKKKWLCGIIMFSVCCMLTGCCISHEWQEATCTTPATCAKCGKTQGEALGHTWVEATCAEPKHCSVCQEIDGEPLEHTWVEATCSEPKHCEVCGATDGEPLEHTLTEANFQQSATCEVCGATVGEPLKGYFEENGIECNAELDTTYPCIAPCVEDNTKTSTGSVVFSDYEVFESDSELGLELLDGYEWRAITVTTVFDDENASSYGVDLPIGCHDYYVTDEQTNSAKNEETGTITINYNGIDYSECWQGAQTLINEWSNEEPYKWTLQVRYYFSNPKGYDGKVVGVGSIDNSNNEIDENYIFFRLK